MLHPAGPAAQTIAELWWIMLACGLAIFALVMMLLFSALHRAANRSGQGASNDERQTRVWVWGFGLGFPLATLAALTGYGLVIGERLLPRTASDLVTVQAEARQWAWTFRYAGAGVPATEGVLHIPAGRPVDVEITSTDVIHSFWVPRLAGKLDAIPGHVNVLRIEAARPGIYSGQGAEFSGRGYREDVFTVEAHDVESWASFLRKGTP
ncbi:MAG: cytochrome c oxidase subunit 2 [Cypionkella sp.]|uniref:cytochrome c oxidase subunit II n=1 Tax=Cypionkella sp. TaxID=2811411 RepID=UPI002607D792|nr:cytochrome B [Cypionkella sp.]MDB5660116.1 cytochrome c oxidase subunit 2 [Cypionkella sp.]